MILCMGLPTTITVAGEWLNSSTFHGDIKCITANGQTIIYVGADYTCHVTIIHFTQKNFGKR